MTSNPPNGRAVKEAAIPKRGRRKALQTEQPVAAAEKSNEAKVCKKEVFEVFFFSLITSKIIDIEAPIKTAFTILKTIWAQL